MPMCHAPSHPFLAATLDIAMSGFVPVRHKTVPLCSGRVLEIGVGTGLNFPHYNREHVTHLCGVEPDPHMLRRAQRRAEQLELEIDLRAVGAEALPWEDANFDAVLCTFVLCTIPDVEQALLHMQRVLRPGGQLIFAEHVRAEGAGAYGLQRMLDPIWGTFAGGCRLTRHAVELMTDAGFQQIEVTPMGRQHYNLLPVLWGTARV